MFFNKIVLFFFQPTTMSTEEGNRSLQTGSLWSQRAVSGPLCFSRSSTLLFWETLIYAKPVFVPLRVQ